MEIIVRFSICNNNVPFTMNVEKESVRDDLPMGLPTSPLYRPGVVGYKIRISSGCYKEGGQIRSLTIWVSCWSLHPDPQRALLSCSRVPACQVVDAESLSKVVMRTSQHRIRTCSCPNRLQLGLRFLLRFQKQSAPKTMPRPHMESV